MISKRKRTIKYAIANHPLAVKRGSERESKEAFVIANTRRIFATCGSDHISSEVMLLGKLLFNLLGLDHVD